MTGTSGWILIVEVPFGEAPDEIRRAWKGCVLPLSFPLPIAEAIKHIVTGRQGEGGYRVDMVRALELLGEKKPEAAVWWQKNYPNLDDLIFDPSACYEVSTPFFALPADPPAQAGQSSFGKFLEHLEENDSADVRLVLSRVIGRLREMTKPEVWQAICCRPLTVSRVLSLVEMVAHIMRRVIEKADFEELFNKESEAGHITLRAIHSQARAEGIEVDLGRVDVPLSIPDWGVREGIWEIVDGKVLPVKESEIN